MNVQIPAEGILKTGEWGDSKVYKVVCNCGQDDHSHNVWIEADEVDVSVTIYTTVKTNFWSKTRWHHLWSLLTKGYIDCETVVSLTKQQSVNYAHTLLTAIDDVTKFRAEKKEKSAAVKLADQGDCI